MTVVNLHSKGAGETRTVIVGLGEKLAKDELILSADTVVELGTADLTLSGLAITSVDQEVTGRLIRAAEGLQFTVAGGTAGEDYRIQVTATTDDTPAQVIVVTLGLAVYA